MNGMLPTQSYEMILKVYWRVKKHYKVFQCDTPQLSSKACRKLYSYEQATFVCLYKHTKIHIKHLKTQIGHHGIKWKVITLGWRVRNGGREGYKKMLHFNVECYFLLLKNWNIYDKILSSVSSRWQICGCLLGSLLNFFIWKSQEQSKEKGATTTCLVS